MFIIEWFFGLFFKNAAEEVKREAFLERQDAILAYAKAKKANKKYLDKYSGRKKFVKASKD
jgi:hypothetical protein